MVCTARMCAINQEKLSNDNNKAYHTTYIPYKCIKYS